MYDGVISAVDSHMSTVADNVARLCLGKAYRISYASHGAGGMGQAHTEVCVYSHNKAGAIGSVGQACTAVYIRIAHELACEADYCIAAAASLARRASSSALDSACTKSVLKST